MPELAVSAQSLINEGAELLRRAALAEPRRLATRLWLELQGGGPGDRLLFDRAVEHGQGEEFREAIRRLVGGEPLAHVTGWAGFRHLSLQSDRRALIPRPETEGLVDLLLQRVRTGVVADIGTGTGCIALSLALEGGFSRVLAVDVSDQALVLAGLNSESCGVSGRVELIRGDLCAAFRDSTLDALISNPPYLTESEYAALDRSVREWEPSRALRGGIDGMEPTAGLIREGIRVVKPAGWLALEVDCSRAGLAAQLAAEHGWAEVSIHTDLFGRERYLLARRSDTR